MYTKEDCINALKKASENVRGPLTATEYRQMDISPSDRTVLNKFGTWNQAKSAAGIRKLRHGVTKYSCNGCYRTDHDGYERFGTSYKGTQRNVGIHRLVAVAEHGAEAVNGKVVHHKNKIPWDNRPSNLEIMGYAEHARHHRMQDMESGRLTRENNRLTWND